MSLQRNTSSDDLHKLLRKLQGINTSTGTTRLDMTATEAFKKAHARVVDILNPATAQHKQATPHHHPTTVHHNQHTTHHHPATAHYNQHTTQYHPVMPQAHHNQHTTQHHPVMPQYNSYTAQNGTPAMYSYT